MTDLLELLSGNPYPGRGIVVGKDRVYYFIMGRSGNSRNRVFTLTEDGIQTQAHDPSKLEDPSLIIYHPVRRIDGALIVTNGDQTDTFGTLWCGGRPRNRRWPPGSTSLTTPTTRPGSLL